MLKFRILCCDRAKDSELEGYIAELIKKSRPFASIEQCFVGVSKGAKLEEGGRRVFETEALLAQLQPQEKVFSLSEEGKLRTSKELAASLEALQVRGSSRFAFLIGGAYGLDKSRIRESGDIISLSPLTFTSQLARTILLEQLYRVLTIIHGTPYHKG